MKRRAILIGAPISAVLLALPAHALTASTTASAGTAGPGSSVTAHGAIELWSDPGPATRRVASIADDGASRVKSAAHASVDAAVAAGQTSIATGRSTSTTVAATSNQLSANAAASASSNSNAGAARSAGAASASVGSETVDAVRQTATGMLSELRQRADVALHAIATASVPDLSVTAQGAASLRR